MRHGVSTGGQGRESFAAEQSVGLAESFRRRTYWHLEKRDGDVDAYIIGARAEADHLLGGGRGYDLLTGRRAVRLFEHYAHIQNWLADPKLDRRVRRGWDGRRMVDAALHRLFLDDVDPYEEIEAEGNLLVTAGITALLNLLKGDAETTFSNANAHLGVGDSSTAAAVGQTDLQAASNKLRKAMNSTYPIDSAPTIDFQATFGSSEANFTWAEVATFNASSSGDMLNRVVQALGTKSSGATWTLTETITWS